MGYSFKECLTLGHMYHSYEIWVTIGEISRIWENKSYVSYLGEWVRVKKIRSDLEK